MAGFPALPGGATITRHNGAGLSLVISPFFFIPPQKLFQFAPPSREPLGARFSGAH